LSEKRSSGSTYVPRDESFSEEKRLTFSAKTIYSVLHALLPSLETAIFDSELGFPNFTAIDSLFNEGVNLPPFENRKKGFLSTLLPRLVKAIANTGEDVLRFETTDTMDSEKTTHHALNNLP
jgi:lipoxygenase